MQSSPEPYQVHEDARGAHSKFFTGDELLPLMGSIQEVFMTTNRKGALRGMHFQRRPAGAKLVSVLTGSVLMKVVNLVPDAEDFGELSFDGVVPAGAKVKVPAGSALGYRALEEETRVLYITDRKHDPVLDVGFHPFAFNWSTGLGDLYSPILSERDSKLPTLERLTEDIMGQPDPVDYIMGGQE